MNFYALIPIFIGIAGYAFAIVLMNAEHNRAERYKEALEEIAAIDHEPRQAAEIAREALTVETDNSEV